MDNLEKVLTALGLRVDKLQSCDIYINYCMKNLSELERKICELKSKINYLQEVCFKNIKEINK